MIISTTSTEIFFRLLVAAVLAGAIGWDREAKARPAGLKTHMLVAVGACGFTLAALSLFTALIAQADRFSLDPLRVMAAIVGGVGFLGAGAVIRSGGEIQGLTTAASIWVAASIGLSAGAGQYSIAIALSLLSLAILVIASTVEERFIRQKNEQE